MTVRWRNWPHGTGTNDSTATAAGALAPAFGQPVRVDTAVGSGGSGGGAMSTRRPAGQPKET
jgi:hypothetical protein